MAKKKKTKKKQEVTFSPTYLHHNALWWCMTHGGVKIYPIVESMADNTYKLCVEYFKPNRSRKVVSSVIYEGMDEVTAKTYEIYVDQFTKKAEQYIVKKSHKTFLKRI